MSDSVKPDLVLSQLEVEAVGPFVLALSGGKRVKFPDPGELHAFEGDAFMSDLSGAATAEDVFAKWLEKGDVEKLRNEKGFTLYKMNALMKKLQAHYEAAFGNAGEDTAS